jgi:hypothetical protein
MTRRRLLPCFDGGRHWWDAGYCLRCGRYRRELVQAVEVVEHQARRWRFSWAPLLGALCALLVVSGALASSAITPAPTQTAPGRRIEPAPSFALYVGPTEEPVMAYVPATYSPPAVTPSPSPTPPNIIPTCGYRAATTDVQRYALSRVGRAEYNCLHAIAEQESHWNPLAINPKSGACGIPQAVPCAKMVPGIPSTSGPIDAATIAVYRAALAKVTPNAQVDWMIRYVQGRGEYYRPFGKAHAFAVAANIKFGGCEGTGAARTCTPGRGWY